MRRKGSDSVRRQRRYAYLERQIAREEEAKRAQRAEPTPAENEQPDTRDPIEVARAAGAALKGNT